MSNRKKLKRLREPTDIEYTNSEKVQASLSDQACRRRRSETMAASVIHGGTPEDNSPTLDGLWHAIFNESTPQRLGIYVSNSKKIMKKVISPIVKKAVPSFEKSKENVARSVKVLYSRGLLSKAKYKNLRLNLSMSSNKKRKGRVSYKFFEDITIPKLLPYHKLVKYINSVHVGSVKSFSDFCKAQSVDDCDPVNGAYRELDEFLLVLAELHIEMDQLMGNNSYPMKFGSEGEYKFYVAIGADGAPFGKNDEATAWLLSFLNSGDRITSQNENFLLAGANCPEDYICMKHYASEIAAEIQVIESKEYFVKQCRVTFSFELVPADMKWLASVSGELINAAYYFSSFANVNNNNKHTVNGSFGPQPDTTWQPWKYKERLEVAGKIRKLKKGLEQKKLSVATKRKKVLESIKALKSRQEFPPLLGPLIDKAYAEPLHNANNSWQFLHKKILHS